MFDGIDPTSDFYFVHNYAFIPRSKENIIAIVNHGVDIVSAVGRENIWGVQFHPEKSSRAGLHLLKNFIGNVVC
jgi:glutamine amidotransferase